MKDVCKERVREAILAELKIPGLEGCFDSAFGKPIASSQSDFCFSDSECLINEFCSSNAYSPQILVMMTSEYDQDYYD